MSNPTIADSVLEFIRKGCPHNEREALATQARLAIAHDALRSMRPAPTQQSDQPGDGWRRELLPAARIWRTALVKCETRDTGGAPLHSAEIELLRVVDALDDCEPAPTQGVEAAEDLPRASCPACGVNLVVELGPDVRWTAEEIERVRVRAAEYERELTTDRPSTVKPEPCGRCGGTERVVDKKATERERSRGVDALHAMRYKDCPSCAPAEAQTCTTCGGSPATTVGPGGTALCGGCAPAEMSHATTWDAADAASLVDSLAPAEGAEEAPAFKVGDRARHRVYGVGTVEAIDPGVVAVRFDDTPGVTTRLEDQYVEPALAPRPPRRTDHVHLTPAQRDRPYDATPPREPSAIEARELIEEMRGDYLEAASDSDKIGGQLAAAQSRAMAQACTDILDALASRHATDEDEHILPRQSGKRVKVKIVGQAKLPLPTWEDDESRPATDEAALAPRRDGVCDCCSDWTADGEIAGGFLVCNACKARGRNDDPPRPTEDGPRPAGGGVKAEASQSLRTCVNLAGDAFNCWSSRDARHAVELINRALDARAEQAREEERARTEMYADALHREVAQAETRATESASLLEKVTAERDDARSLYTETESKRCEELREADVVVGELAKAREALASIANRGCEYPPRIGGVVCGRNAVRCCPRIARDALSPAPAEPAGKG